MGVRSARQQQREHEVEDDAQRHRHADRAQHRHVRDHQQRKHHQRRKRTDEHGVQRAPLLGTIRCGVLEEQRVVESQAGREYQRDQVKQVERHAAPAQHGEHDECRERHRREHTIDARSRTQRERDHADEQQRCNRQRPEHARALCGHERFRLAFRVEQSHVVAGGCRECSQCRYVLHAAERDECIAFCRAAARSACPCSRRGWCFASPRSTKAAACGRARRPARTVRRHPDETACRPGCPQRIAQRVRHRADAAGVAAESRHSAHSAPRDRIRRSRVARSTLAIADRELRAGSARHRCPPHRRPASSARPECRAPRAVADPAGAGLRERASGARDRSPRTVGAPVRSLPARRRR